MKVGRTIEKGKSVKYAPGIGPPGSEKCPETGAHLVVGGPIWAEKIHNPDWIKGILTFMKEREQDFAAFGKYKAC